MTRKDAKERARQRRNDRREEKRTAKPAPILDQDGSTGGPVRPPPIQLARGSWRIPEGRGRDEAPTLNMKPDCIAALMANVPRLLTRHQYDAARAWQEFRTPVLAELGLAQGRSCLDVVTPGHDEGDGDPELALRWRNVWAALGVERIRSLDRTCIDGAWPADLDGLREALGAFEAFTTRRLTRARNLG